MRALLKRLFNRSRLEPKTYEIPVLHFLKRLDSMGTRIEISACGFYFSRPKAEDYLIIPNGESTTRYQIEEMKWANGPDDLLYATCKFAPRVSGAAAKGEA